jgi:asparagine synthetase B (glutamine-hydrolysing)
MLVLASFYRRQWEMAAQVGAQVHIRGDFGDELLGASFKYLSALWQEHRLFRLVGELHQWHRVCDVALPSLVEKWLIHPLLRHEKHAQIPWLPQQVQQLGMERHRQDEAYLRKLCPDPFQRELVRWMHLHTDYNIQADVALHMAGLETREPYADMRLIHFLLATPPQYQIRPSLRKFLLREAMQGALPERVRQRKGKGHAHHYYFQGITKYRDQLRHVIVSMPEILTPYIDREPLLNTLDHVALGGMPASVPALSGTLALILWAHRLPWAGGILPIVP